MAGRRDLHNVSRAAALSNRGVHAGAERAQLHARAERLREADQGYATEQDREAAKAAGFDLHYAKPLDPEQLQEIYAALGRARERDGQTRPA